jgi:hypothetical protein
MTVKPASNGGVPMTRSTSAAVTKVEQGSTTPNIVLQAFAAEEGASVQFDGTGPDAPSAKARSRICP